MVYFYLVLMQDFFQQIFKDTPSKISKLPGGDINDVYEVIVPRGEYIVKVNDAEKFPGMLQKEKIGLETLAASKSVLTPKVLGCGAIAGKQFLVLEKICTVNSVDQTWIHFGRDLAKMHQTSSENFGFESDNYIGSLVQQNDQQKTWTEFLITQRLQPMLELAVNQGDVNYVEAKIFDSLFSKLNELIPKEKPALLHGDLWSGNFLVGPAEEAVLIDPAVYYGHREMDLAMMHLFGGFSPKLFDAYHEIYPLEKGWQKRIDLNQLYPLLVHLNLFGRSYWDRVKKIVDGYL
jgi:protein-ribulosamine 3-kinase